MCEQINTIQQKLETARVALSDLYNAIGVLKADVRALETTVDEANARALPPLVERAIIALSGEYKLRSFYELIDQLSASREAICDALDAANVGYVLKRRNRDGAELIGLAERN